MVTLEELDSHKKGMTEVARNARQASRFLDEIGRAAWHGIDARHPALDAISHEAATGQLFLQTQAITIELPMSLPPRQGGQPDPGRGACACGEQHPERQVILVSKDINMRIKARALGLPAEDYFNDKVLEDTDLLYTGVRELPADFWEQHGQGMESWQQRRPHLLSRHRAAGAGLLHQRVRLPGSAAHAVLCAWCASMTGKTAVLETHQAITRHAKNNVWGITARNREQNFALNLLMDPEIDFVTLLGQAGTGKTLLDAGRRAEPRCSRTRSTRKSS